MGGRKNIKQKKNKRSKKVLGMMEKIYSGAWLLGEERRLRKHRGGSGEIWGKDECEGEETKTDFRRGELPGKFMVKMLYGWDNGKFEEEYLKKLERNWQK